MSGSPEIVHLKSVQSPLKLFTSWERNRHGSVHWLAESVAEFLGVFFYTYAGVGATIVFILGNILEEQGLGSILQVGFAYACGIMFAITICAPTSGGQFNPCITIVMILFKGFPPLKGLRYIVSQILGGYIACLLVYAQYRDLIVAAEGLLAAAQKSALLFTPNGPAGAFGLYVLPGSHLGRVFLNEFITDIVLALIIFGCTDPTNIHMTPAVTPVIIGIAYGVAIWGFAVPGLAANAARDVGGRLAAITIWGTRANGGAYAAIAALTNIPATIIAFLLHELFLTDYSRVVPSAQREYMMVHAHHAHNPDRPQDNSRVSDGSSGLKDSGSVQEVETMRHSA